MSENGAIKTTNENGEITLEREHIDLDINQDKAPLWAALEDQNIPHTIIENGGVHRTADTIPDSSQIIGARNAPNKIYGAHSALTYNEGSEFPINRSTQVIEGGMQNDQIFADQFKNGIEIPVVTVKSNTAPNGILDIPAGDENYVFAYAGNDLVVAGHGNNWIEAGTGSDSVKLGNGDNFVDAGVDPDVDTVELGSGYNTVRMYTHDRLITNGSFADVGILGTNFASENSITANEPSAVFVDGGEKIDFDFTNAGFGFARFSNSAFVNINIDKADLAAVEFQFDYRSEDRFEFSISGENNEGEFIELGSGFTDAVEKIALEYASENDPSSTTLEIGIDALSVGDHGRFELLR